MWLLILLATLLVLLRCYFHHCYQYWSKRKIPCIPPKFPLGNNNIILPTGFTIGTVSKTFYDYFKERGERFGGVYLVTEPNLLILDPDLIKDIFLKDFHCFADRGFYHNKKNDPISANIFALDGPEWRQLRTKFTPAFTSSKMKFMFHSMVKCSKNMLRAIDQNLDKDLDIKEIMGRYTTDCIGSCAFGVDCNSFTHPDAEFRKMGIKNFQFDLWRSLRAFFIVNVPKFAKFLGLTVNSKEIREFFTNLAVESLEKRKDKTMRRSDFLQILIDLKEAMHFTMDEMAAQVFLFFVAGYESSSVVLSFALYEIANNKHIQDRLRREICKVLDQHDGQITYDSIGEMKYLGQVFDETVRKYPPGTTLNRRCIKDYTLANSDFTIEKGTQLIFSVLGLHRDPEYYPDPDTFDPERFTDEEKQSRHPYTYLPFGNGPRNCLGLRFGRLQVKVGIASIVKNFELSVSPRMAPLKLDPHVFVLRSVDPIYLKAVKV